MQSPNAIFPKRPDWAAILLAVLMVAWLLAVLMGCGTEKQFRKFATKHPGEAAEYFTSHYPIIPDTAYIKGKDSLIYVGAANLPFLPGQDVSINPVDLPAKIKNIAGLKVIVFHRTDTLKIEKENPAKDDIIAKQKRENATLTEKLEEKSGKLSRRTALLWGSWAAVALFSLIKVVIKYNGFGAIGGFIKQLKKS